MKVICRPNKQKIDEWYWNGWLADTFYRACGEVSGGVITSFFFSDIWAPTLKWNEDKTKGPLDPPEWEWKNYGFTQQDIADAYWAQFGWCSFPEYFATDAEQATALSSERSKVYRLIKATLTQNKMKYKKLIDLAGFAYSPLNNVDAHELYSVLENHGGITRDSGSTTSSGTRTNMRNEHNVAPYDGGDTATKTEYEDITSGSGSEYNPSATVGDQTISAGLITSPSSVSAGVAQTTDTETHNHAKNLNANGQEVDYAVDAKNNAFEADVKGGDYYKVEKHRRYGNIGVTKTQELLEAERENLKYNLLQEFFNDINKVVLLGVY